MNTIKFEVPYNGDSLIISFYCDHKDHIAMVYGRAEDGYPQGRKTSSLPPISEQNIVKQVEILGNQNIPFNYLLNGICHGNKEFSTPYRKEFINFVKRLLSYGVKIVTLSNLFFIEVIANEVPGIEIFASAILEVDCLARLKQVAKLGIKYSCLSKTIYKNFVALESIGKYCERGIESVLLVNDPCLHHCAYTNYHNIILSHLTGDNIGCSSFCRLHCTKEFAQDDRCLISASFIRPEDLTEYSKLGFSIFKLCDRKHRTEWIIRAFNAYIQGNYEGNLALIMAPWNKHEGQYDVPIDISVDEVLKRGEDALRNEVRFTPYINNRGLDDYLKFWKEYKRLGCRDEDCDRCGYCAKIASEVIKGNPAHRRTIIRNINHVLQASTMISEERGEKS
ncbi:MAG: hypothetical protein ABH830_03465 [Patescibacteria group bacterium]